MKVSVAHPHTGSFDHAIAETVIRALKENMHTFCFHDMYQERFDPVLAYDEIFGMLSCPLSSHAKLHKDCYWRLNFFVHPDWWGMPPATLKGWIDQVFRPGLPASSLKGMMVKEYQKGLLKAKTARVINTSKTPHEGSWKCSAIPPTILEGLHPLISVEFQFSTEGWLGLSSRAVPEQRKPWLDEVRELIRYTFPTGIL